MPADCKPLMTLLPSLTLRQALSQASDGIDPRDARVLLAHVLGKDRAWLLAHAEDDLPPGEQAAFSAAVAARRLHKPLQYITGCQEFYGLPLRVSPATLIPRPETELLVDAVLAWACTLPIPATAERPLCLADVGTGTGAIALALAAHLPHVQIHALDNSPAVGETLEHNIRSLGFERSIRFTPSDLLAAWQPQAIAGQLLVAGQLLDAVVSNPPYIPDGDAAELAPEVRDFEPPTALFAGPDGLDVYRRLIPQAKTALRPSGLLALEFGFGQQPALEALLRGWQDVRFLNDIAGIPRVALALRS